MKLLAGPKVYASAHPQQKLTLSLPDSDDQAGDSDDSLFDVSDGEDFALLPRAPELVLYPVMRVFTTRADLPTHFQLAVELPPPKV